ncbi:MAG: class I SAM-dependent methyltransferase [Marinicella sp.]|nr:class I SAM-dependent methyltransferase [Xanthomonadales bacterium]
MERYDTKDSYHAWYEHWHRYHWISTFVNDLKVADLACGEGYGSALLAQHAKEVTGVDFNAETIQKATDKYQTFKNLKYIQSDVLSAPMQDHAVDMVVSFETLEHLTTHHTLLKEFKRLMKPNGLLVISTPDKTVYSGSEGHNEFHLKELTHQEFTNLIDSHFKHALFFGQQLQTGSVLAPLTNQPTLSATSLYVEQHDEFITNYNQQSPTYLIAVASDSFEALLPFKSTGISHFNDSHNKLFNHYEQQIKRLLEADLQLKKLETQIEIQNQVINQLKARLGL